MARWMAEYSKLPVCAYSQMIAASMNTDPIMVNRKNFMVGIREVLKPEHLTIASLETTISSTEIITVRSRPI